MNGAFLNPSPCSADMLPRCLAGRTGENKATLVDHENKIRWSPETRLGVVHGCSVTEVKNRYGSEGRRECLAMYKPVHSNTYGSINWSSSVE